MTRRGVSIIVLASFASSCSTWRVQTLTPQQVVVERRPAEIWVTRTNGSGVRLETPTIRNDSLIGWDRKNLRNVGMPLRDVRSIEIREPDSTKTVYTVLGVIAGVGLLVVLALYAIVASDVS